MTDLANLIDINYLTVDPPVSMVYMWPTVIVLAIFVVIAVTLWIWRGKVHAGSELTRRVLGLMANWLFYPSLIALLLIFFRNQGITLISWRLWLLALMLVWVAGAIYVLYTLIFYVPRERRKINVQKIKSKYMPGPKEVRR